MNERILDKIVDRLVGDAPSPSSPARRQIVILQRGWVVVGTTQRVGDTLLVHNASVIRRWGTTKGLGQIALSGPTKDTVLDPCGTVEAPMCNVVATIDVSKEVSFV